MRFKAPVIILAASLAAGFWSCNDNEVENAVIQNVSGSNVEVTSFVLKSNFGTEDLDSLSFAVDLNKGVIFNADSLPVGTKVVKALVSLGLPSVSKAEIVMHYEDTEKEDVIVDYLTSPSDSIDFSADKVTVRLVSANEGVRREYNVKVNVHQLKSDSLYWDRLPYCVIPGASSAALATRTVSLGGKYYVFTQFSDKAFMSAGENLADAKEWVAQPVALPENALVGSITASEDALFMLDSSDKLFTSTDGTTWTDTGDSMCYIYGGYGASILGVKNSEGKYYHVTYPATAETEVAEGCPVSGTSSIMIYETMWSDSPMAAFTSGKDSKGNLSGATWGYDGSEWTKLSVEAMPPAEGVSVCPYYTVSSSATAATTTTPVLYAFGGKDKNGAIDNKLYVSIDRGVHWAVASENLQFNDYVPKLAGAQAMVCDRTLYVPSDAAVASRAIKPVTSWECPYIYLIGGTFENNRFNPNIYRGVINFFSFIPIQ